MLLNFNNAKNTTATYSIKLLNGISLTHEQVEQKVSEFIAKLPPELRDCIIPDALVGPIFSHPFYYQVDFTSHVLWGLFTPDTVVKSIASRRAAYEEFCARGEFEGAVQGVSAPYRRGFLLDLINEYGVERLYLAIRAVWTGVENISDDYFLWDDVWSQVAKSDGDHLNVMQADERKVFETLPDALTVYRGFGHYEGEIGWSWTLDRDKAEWFARRWSANDPMVATVTIPKSEALAFFDGCKESEIVIHPDYLAWSVEIKLEALSELEAAA